MLLPKGRRRGSSERDLRAAIELKRGTQSPRLKVKVPGLRDPFGGYMLRRTLLCAAAAACLFAASPISGVLADAGAIPMPPDRAADSYAIYSVLMPGAPFDSMSGQYPRWAIADTTVNISDMDPAVPPEGQLKPPDDHPKRFQEAVRDFDTRKYQRLQLTQQLNLAQPYELLNSDQVAELRRAKTAVDAGSELQAKYASYPGVTFFSQVYFNAGHTAALVYMNNWCANLCQQGQWVYLEKHGGSWVRRSGIYEKISGTPARTVLADSSLQPQLPAGLAADSYAIYSLLLPGARFDHISPRQVSQWGLADTTINVSDMNPAIPPKGQLKAPPENVEAFDQANRDFEARKYQRFLLNPHDFRNHLYPLLNKQQVGDRRRGGSGGSGIAFFSAVYFNNQRTAALVYVNVWCANLCSAGEWVYLEKQGGSWVRRSGIYEKMS